MMKMTDKVGSIEYAIRDIVVPAKELEKKGEKIIYLNIGDPIAYDFDTPEEIKAAIIKFIKEGKNGYSDSKGVLRLREAIALREKRENGIDLDPEKIIVTQGISEAINFVFNAVLEKGDEVLVPGPTYPTYISYAKLNQATAISYETIEEQNWQPNIEDIRKKITEKTKIIVIINPNNPTGAVYDEKVVKDIIDVAAEHEIVIISDEIYDKITYDKKVRSTASLTKDVPVIVFNGFSKVYLATGWRLGYMYFMDPEDKIASILEGVERQARIRLCANTPAQLALAETMNTTKHINELVLKLKNRRDYAWKRLNEIEGIKCTKPDGAFYLFPRVELDKSRWKSDKEFVLDFLLKEKVLVVHGSGFDETYGKNHFRAVFLPPLDTLEEAFTRLERFITKG